MRTQTKFKSDTLKASEDFAAHSSKQAPGSKLGVFTYIDRSVLFSCVDGFSVIPVKRRKEKPWNGHFLLVNTY